MEDQGIKELECSREKLISDWNRYTYMFKERGHLNIKHQRTKMMTG
jgi:hypothetical protein